MQQSTYQLREKSSLDKNTLFDDIFSVVKGKKENEIEVKFFFEPSISYRRLLSDLPEEHDTYRSSNEVMKITVREALSRLYLQYELNGHVLTLDDCRASFSDHLNKRLQMPKEKIHVANPFVSRSIVSQDKCILYPHKVGTMIRNFHSKHKPFSLVFLDYTCTWKGSLQTTPSKDIETVFRFLKMTRQSILAVTICTRTTKKKKTYLEDVHEAREFIIESASRCRKGCHVDCIDVITYGVIATMIFIVYQ
jgi:hypothetical protein